MHFNYISYWAIWHGINSNFAQVTIISITFLITFSDLLRKMCYERTKINICPECFSTFLIPSASFLQPSWILTVTFHLYALSAAYFHLPITNLCKTSIMGGVYGWSKLLAWDNTPAASYITYMTPKHCRIMYTQHHVRYATQTHYSMSV